MEFTEIEEKIGYRFKDRQFLLLSFIHRSFWNEHKEKLPGHNERLEFLGDSVLGLLISEYLYQKFPELPEGVLSDLRSQVVKAESCALFVQKLDIGEFLLLGKGEQMNVGRGRDTMLADLFEAIIGAIYLDQGFDAAKQFFFSNFGREVEEIVSTPIRNPKAELQDYAQKTFGKVPHYEVLEETGPSHQKHFRIAVFINEKMVGQGEGSSKKEAQSAAAKQALENL